MGRLVANHDFVKALLKYGAFDEYVFSNPSNANLKSFESTVQKWGLPSERLRLLRFVPYFSLPGILKRERFTVFHLGGWGYFMPGLHYLRSRYASNPWPITAVTHSLHGRHSVDFAVRLHTAGMATFDSVFCSSCDGRSAMANLLEVTGKITGTHYNGHLDWLPLGIDDELLQTRGDRTKARDQMRIPPEAVVLLCLGRLTPALKMDLAPILESFAKDILPNCRRPVYLVIAGGADSLNLRMVQELIRELQLENWCRVRANFRTEVKGDLLASADIFLSLSDNTQETFGLSLLEAQASSLPVVASRFDGYKDLVREAVDGYLIDTYGCVPDPVREFSDLLDPDVAQLFEAQKVAIDMNQFARKLLELIHDDKRRSLMGEKGRGKVASEFVFSRIIKRYDQRWDDLFQEAQSHGLPPTVEDRFQVDPSLVFRHYVSKSLAPGDQVMTRQGQALCPSYNEVSVLLDPSELKRILEAAADPIPVKDLVEMTPLSIEQAWFAVMWLIKYNRLIALKQEKGNGE
jgi:glycosyltransferase involved in cell wall biosynthesis